MRHGLSLGLLEALTVCALLSVRAASRQVRYRTFLRGETYSAKEFFMIANFRNCEDFGLFHLFLFHRREL